MMLGLPSAVRSSRFISAIDDAIDENAFCMWFDQASCRTRRTRLPEVRLHLGGPVEASVGPMVRSLAGCHLIIGPAPRI